MAVSNNAFIIGAETTYGTAVTPTRGMEAQADSFKKDMDSLESIGFRPGIQALRADRRKMINMGGEGNIQVDFLSSGMGLFLSGAFDNTAGPVVTQTTVNTYTFTSGATGPTQAFTVQMIRSSVDAGTFCYTHVGSILKNWDITASVGEQLNISADFDCQNVITSATAGTPTYPTNAVPFDWTQGAVSINSVAQTSVNSFELKADQNMKTDRMYLQGSALKKKPVRSDVAEYSGTIEADFSDQTLNTLWANGTVFPMSITFTGALITGTTYNSVTITLPCCQFDGDDPVSKIDDISTVKMPFHVLDPGNGTAAVTLTWVTTDTAL